MINRLGHTLRGARGRAVCILTALLSLSGARDASAVGWQAIPGAPSAGRLDDLHFLDPLTGWVCTSSGEIWRTTTGGASWELQLATSYYMRTIYFADAQTGFAGTLGSQLLFRTTDGGAKWNAVPNSVFPALPPAICGMSGAGDHVYGTGAYFAPAMLVRSTDRGVTWGSVDMSSYARNLIDCHFVTPISGFAVGGSPGTPSTTRPVILHTDDGGTTWQTRYLGTTPGRYCWKIFFVDPQLGFVSVYSLSGASVLKTTDGGLSWNAIEIPGNDSLEGIGFATPNLGWVDGWQDCNQTTNGGATWQPYLIGGGASAVNRFQFFSPTKAYAVGYTVFRYDGDPADAPALPVVPSPSPFALSAAPNPFSETTTIRFRLPVAARAQVRLFDALGREMQTLLDAELPAGEHTVEWDGRDAAGVDTPAGAYLYRVDAGGRAESHSMLRLR